MVRILEKYLWKFLRKTDPAYHSAKPSWAQQGEDMIIDFIFTWQLGCPMPSYLDIGTNHPTILNNTYFFYKKGCRGVNIEPDPELIGLINKKRPNDVNLNIGIGITEEENELDFYKMSQSTLNTFSKETAELYSLDKQFGYPEIMEIKKIKVLPVNEILKKYFTEKNNYFISIDVEGLDFEVLCQIDFSKYRPSVVCIETNQLNGNSVEKYLTFFDERGYLQYADTGINSIFVDIEKIRK